MVPWTVEAGRKVVSKRQQNKKKQDELQNEIINVDANLLAVGSDHYNTPPSWRLSNHFKSTALVVQCNWRNILARGDNASVFFFYINQFLLRLQTPNDVTARNASVRRTVLYSSFLAFLLDLFEEE